jgi:hypothetical protein
MDQAVRVTQGGNEIASLDACRCVALWIDPLAMTLLQ